MTEPAAGNFARTELRVHLSAAGRGVGWPFGRLIVTSQELAVRSAGSRWIPARSISQGQVGDICVVKRIEIHLPILRWRRMEIMRFAPGSTFADVSIKLSGRRRIVDVLRAHGYSVADHRT